MKKIEEIRKPYVFKHRDSGSLIIIYKNRVELYSLDRKETKKQIREKNNSGKINLLILSNY